MEFLQCAGKCPQYMLICQVRGWHLCCQIPPCVFEADSQRTVEVISDQTLGGAIMQSTSLQLLNEMERYMRGAEKNCSRWFIGVSNDADKLLSRVHSLNRKQNPWIYVTAQTPAEAQLIRDHLINRLGGTSGPGREAKGRMVYAFAKDPTVSTAPRKRPVLQRLKIFWRAVALRPILSSFRALSNIE